MFDCAAPSTLWGQTLVADYFECTSSFVVIFPYDPSVDKAGVEDGRR